MRLEKIILRQIRMPLVHFFETSFGRTTERHMVLVEAVGEGDEVLQRGELERDVLVGRPPADPARRP